MFLLPRRTRGDLLLRDARRSANMPPAGGSRRDWPLPQTGPALWKTKGLCPRAEWVCEKHIPPAVRGAAVIRAHRAQLRSAEDGPGMAASAPRVDMGPGPPATACRKYRTATSHDELSNRPAR